MSDTPLKAKKKCIVYIDGFNLYWGILRHHPEWKWLNIQALFEAMRLDDDVICVKYFTAVVEPDKVQSTTREKQAEYLKALKSTPKVAVVYGKFQLRDVTCRSECKQKHKVAEEKKTDVNIAVNLMNDAIKNHVERIVIVSGDSDLEPAVEWIRKNYPSIKISVYIPCIEDERGKRRNDFYPKIGVFCRFMNLAILGQFLFPDEVELPDGSKAVKPAAWVVAAEALPEP